MATLSKICTKCKIEQPISEYWKQKQCPSGHCPRCRTCESKRSKSYRVKDPARMERARARTKQWGIDNYERKREMDKAYSIAHKDEKIEYGRVYYQINKQSIQQYQKENKGRINARNAKRRAAQMCRTPLWLSNKEKEQIKHLYEYASTLSGTTGMNYHVDHIIPLQGEIVSGLHVLNNLRVIPAALNISKGNRYGNAN